MTAVLSCAASLFPLGVTIREAMNEKYVKEVINGIIPAVF